MRAFKVHLSLLFLALVALASGCATPGAPQPPSLNLPRPVEDLQAERHGNRVVLSWSEPLQTTDHLNIRHYGLTNLCRALREYPMGRCTNAVRQLSLVPQRQADGTLRNRFTVEDILPNSLLSPSATATYAVEVFNPSGRSAGLSNQVRLSLAPVPPPALDLAATLRPDGVHLRWTAPTLDFAPARCRYKILRSPAEKQAFFVTGEIACQPGDMNFADGSVEWEKHYLYKVIPLTIAAGGEALGEESPAVDIFVHDVFPPAAPQALEAVFGGEEQKLFIDLTWEPNSESDIVGYILFRRVEGSTPQRITPKAVAVAAFRDEKVAPGVTYYYSVQAVDTQGNLSPLSQETSESVPATDEP